MAVPDAVLYRLIALNAYAAYRNCLSGTMSPFQRQRFDRMTHPQPGDLVLELTTIWQWLDHPDVTPGVGLGHLLRVADEPVISQTDLDALHAAGEWFMEPGEGIADLPTEPIVYLRPLDGSRDEVRWHNATFLQVAQGAADVTDGR